MQFEYPAGQSLYGPLDRAMTEQGRSNLSRANAIPLLVSIPALS